MERTMNGQPKIDREQMKKGLIELIENHQGEALVLDGSDLLDSGQMDSYTMLLMITHVRNHYQIDLDMERLNFDVFRSLDAFIDLVLETQ